MSTEKPVEIKSWNPVAIWKFKSSGDDCVICKEKMVSLCIECSTNQTKDSKCDVSRANCGHSFHKHCIDKWLTSATNCPICTVPINISVKNMNSDENWQKLLKGRK